MSLYLLRSFSVSKVSSRTFKVNISSHLDSIRVHSTSSTNVLFLTKVFKTFAVNVWSTFYQCFFWLIYSKMYDVHTCMQTLYFIQTMTKLFFIVYYSYTSIYLLRWSFIFQTDGGAVYVRWGRKSCPGGAHLVYSGIGSIIGNDVLMLSTHTHTHIGTPIDVCNTSCMARLCLVR